ncbi:TPA: N-acetylneuraminate synthase [Escherichia coli]|nr:N-acetylneuraminate synthase [Escherichia coli]
MNHVLKQIASQKQRGDIVIIGKGPSIDQIDLSLLKNCIVINTNDSELIYPGDIAVFHHGWVLDIFDEQAPQCKLYVSDRNLPEGVEHLSAEFIPYTPESADFLIQRFFSETIHIESAIVVTALKIANQIALSQNETKNVYLLGFDFTIKGGVTSKIPCAALHAEPEYQERIISSQEQLLQMLLAEKTRLNININHVGNKPYSVYSVDAFNQVFASRHRGVVLPTHAQISTTSSQNGVKVIAEITTNHFGDMDRLKSMIVAAKQAGADYIKLQKRDVESFYSREKLESPYNSPFGTTFRDYRHGIELNEEQFSFVDSFCKEIGIGWFASILDMPSYEFIRQFEPDMIKLPSTISEHKDYLAAVASDFTKDVVISTGYTDEAYERFILDNFTKVRNIYLLQCTSAYPTPNEDTQLGVIRHYYNLAKKDPRIIPGFSSHDIGSLCSMMAVAAGAKMIEKHVKFGNVAWSHFDEVAIDLVNGDFAQFVKDVRKAERIVGSEVKVIHSTEHHKYWVSPR